MMYRVPAATYRLQFNSGFTFRDAAAAVPYLAELGISDIYASPILRARKGSPHGYDVVDATALNPELGTEEDFHALHEALRDRGLGLLLDVVPNHMAASEENAWWMSVLENGPHSRFLHYFDIAWSPVTTRGQTVEKLLLPILGRPYGEALEAQQIQLAFDADGFFFRYYEKRLPLAPQTYVNILRDCVDALPQEGVAIELRELVAGGEDVPNSRFLKETLWRIHEGHEVFRRILDTIIVRLNGERGDPDSFRALDALLDGQWYRLAYWRMASEKINYRRFFDVTDLVGVRVENPEVFEARNHRTLELVAEGKVTGLRIDHIDGLYDPISHMRKLQLRLGNPFYIVVEKILTHGEALPGDFPVAGTTGYDFCDAVNALFVDADGLQRLDAFYRRFTGVTESFADICYARKKQIIHELFAGEMRALGKQLSALALADRNARDFAPSELLAALTEITACLRVYRTYVRDETIAEEDRRTLIAAATEARARAGAGLDGRLLAFLERVLLLQLPSYATGEREKWLAFVLRWQQFTGRVMAKGVEDTAFYNYNRLVSLNEVGGEPGRGSFNGLAEYHAHNGITAAAWPHTLNATATHDTKRSEDIRARLNVLSEIPALWEREVRHWSKLNAALRTEGIPHPNEELLVYQTLVGMWPLDPAERTSVPERLQQYLEKAAREAKTQTSWLAPNADYERALLRFAEGALQNEHFLDAFLPFQRRIAFYGFLNALAQVVLKATSPGVPDFYQGTELWDFSLVDPDNRRPVDYGVRSAMLGTLSNPEALLRKWQDGRIKLFVTQKTLALRGARPDLFRDGGYAPIDAGASVIAFTRGGSRVTGEESRGRDSSNASSLEGDEERGGFRLIDPGSRAGDTGSRYPASGTSSTSDAVLVVVPRFFTRLTRLGEYPIGERVWSDAKGIPNPGGRWRNIYTEEIVEGDTLELRHVFASFPVAVLQRA